MPEEKPGLDPANLALWLLLAAAAICTTGSLALFTTSLILQGQRTNIPSLAGAMLLDYWALGFLIGLGITGMAVAIKLIRRGGK